MIQDDAAMRRTLPPPQCSSSKASQTNTLAPPSGSSLTLTPTVLLNKDCKSKLKKTHTLTYNQHSYDKTHTRYTSIFTTGCNSLSKPGSLLHFSVYSIYNAVTYAALTAEYNHTLCVHVCVDVHVFPSDLHSRV